MEQHLLIPAGESPLAAILHIPEHAERYGLPLIIICHGFIGSKTGVNRLFVKAARQFCEQNFAVIRFDYRGAGESTGSYGENTFPSFVEQTQSVIDYAETLDFVDKRKIILLGHSLGGAVAVLTASRDARVNNLALWAPVLYPKSDILRIVGNYIYREALATGHADYEGYLFSRAYFESLADLKPSEDLLKFRGNVFIAHGTYDDEIPYQYSQLFETRLKGHVKHLLIEKADHTFSSYAATSEVVSKTLKWCHANLDPTTKWSDWTI
jgi:pimeloyl-ACP methyl ester carboxylesterase